MSSNIPNVLAKLTSGANAAVNVDFWRAKFGSSGPSGAPTPFSAKWDNDKYFVLVHFSTPAAAAPLITLSDLETGNIFASFNAPPNCNSLAFGLNFKDLVCADDINAGAPFPCQGVANLPDNIRKIRISIAAAGAGVTSTVVVSCNQYI